MTHRLALAVFAAGLLSASAAVAQNNPAPADSQAVALPAAAPAQAAAPNPQVASDSNNPVICRYENEAGTRFMHRICRTEREWKQKERDAYDLLDRLDSGKNQAIFQ